MRRPNSGRCSNQPRSRPATVADDDRARRLDAERRRSSPSVPRTVRCSGRVPQRTAATGVSASRPPAISAFAISRDAARAHEHHERAARAARARPSRCRSLPLVGSSWPVTTVKLVDSPRCVTGNARRTRRAAIALVMPGTTSNGDAGVAARLGLFAAAAEHERVAALQPHDLEPGRAARRRAAR